MYEFYCMMIILYEFNCSMTTFNCLLFCCSSREKKAPKNKVLRWRARGSGKNTHSKVASLHEDSHTDTLNPQQRSLFEEESTPNRVWRGGGVGVPSWEHIKIHKLRGVRVSSRTKRVRAKRGRKKKKGSGVSREKEKNLDKCERKAGRERRAWREKREKRGRRMEWKHFGCDESQHCHWSREGREGSRGRWKDQKKKKWDTFAPPPSPTLSPATKGIFVLGSWVCGNNLPNIENKWSVGSEFSPMLLQRKHSGSSQQGLTINQQFAHWSAEGGGRGQHKAKQARTERASTLPWQSKLQSEEFKSQQIREGYYLDEGIYLYIYSREKIQYT